MSLLDSSGGEETIVRPHITDTRPNSTPNSTKEETSVSNPVVHFEIGGKDGKKLEAFYGSLFDWKITFEKQYNYRSVEKGGENGIGGGIFENEDGSPSIRFYVAVDDPQGYLDKAKKLGGKTLMPPTPLPGVGTLAMFSDLEGNAVGLWKAEQS